MARINWQSIFGALTARRAQPAPVYGSTLTHGQQLRGGQRVDRAIDMWYARQQPVQASAARGVEYGVDIGHEGNGA